MFRIFSLLGALLPSLWFHHASAANTITWKNHCDYDLYFWVIPSKTLERNDAYQRVPARGEFVHAMVEGSVSVKFRDVPYYTVAPAGIIQAEYFLDHESSKTWYDSSIINCDRSAGPQSPSYCPFAHGGINMYIPEKRGPMCRDAYCRLGGQCDKNTYLRPGGYDGEPSLSCGIGVDIVLETCAEYSVERTWEKGRPGPPPAPAPWQPLPQPQQPQQQPPHPTYPDPVPSSYITAEVIDPTVTIEPTSSKPDVFPRPPGLPEEAVCFDLDCKCYGFWGESQPGRSDCTNTPGAIECHFFDKCNVWRRKYRKR